MRLFYWLKLMQALVVIFLLVRILSTSELCSVMISSEIIETRINDESCKQLLREMGSVGMTSSSTPYGNAIHDSESVVPASKTRLGVFFSDVLKSWDKLWGNGSHSTAVSTSPVSSTVLPPISSSKPKDITTGFIGSNSTESTPQDISVRDVSSTKKDQSVAEDVDLSSTNPPALSTMIGVGFRQCLKVSFTDIFAFGPVRSDADRVLRLFSAPVFCLLIHLIIVFTHTLVQNAGPYRTGGVILLIASGYFWVFLLLAVLTIDYNWERMWILAGSFTPELMGAVLDAEIISLLMFLVILIESFFNEHLAKDVQLKRVNNFYKVNERSSAGYDEGYQMSLLSGNGCIDCDAEESNVLASVVVPSK